MAASLLLDPILPLILLPELDSVGLRMYLPLSEMVNGVGMLLGSYILAMRGQRRGIGLNVGVWMPRVRAHHVLWLGSV